MGVISVSNVNFFATTVVVGMFTIYHIIAGDYITFMPKLLAALLVSYYTCMYVLPIGIVGLLGTALNFYMCGATFPTIIPALEKKDPAYINLAIVGMGTINSFLWLTFGFLTSDPFVWSPNVPGIGLGFLQIYTGLWCQGKIPDTDKIIKMLRGYMLGKGKEAKKA